MGGVLVVLLESDEKIKKTKGETRPINSQNIRAEILSELKSVDYIILAPKTGENGEYGKLVKKIKPDFIAVTKGDPNIKFKEKTAKLVQAKIKYVTSVIKGYSTGKMLEKSAREKI